MSKQIEFIVMWIAIIILMYISTFHNKISKKNQNIIILLMVILFSVFYGYRTLGMDLRNYISYYDRMTISGLRTRLQFTNLLSNEYEPLFLLVTYIAKNVGFSAQQWLLTMVVFPSLICFYYIKKNKYPLVTFMMFMLIMMFQIDLTRFYLAVPFLLISFITKHKSVKYFCYIIALGFHYSAIFVLFCDIVSKIKWTKRKYFILFCVVLCGAIFLRLIDLSALSESSFRLLFKFQYYLKQSWSSSDAPFVLQVLLILINVYPIIMCNYICNNLNSYKIINSEFNLEYIEKISAYLKLGVYVSCLLVVFWGSFQMGFRLLLMTYFYLFIPLGDSIGPYLKNGVIRGIGIRLIASIFLYDIFMAIYYLAISIYY